MGTVVNVSSQRVPTRDGKARSMNASKPPAIAVFRSVPRVMPRTLSACFQSANRLEEAWTRPDVPLVTADVIVSTRRRPNQSSAMIAMRNGVIVLYGDHALNAVPQASKTPMASAPISVPHSERSWPTSAAAREEMTRKVSVTPSSRTKSESSKPAAPHRNPEPSQAAASTRRTGTPSIAVISRLSASDRIAVPSFVLRRNSAVPAVIKIPNAKAMICVQLTRTSPSE
jgi:hypothetical protein